MAYLAISRVQPRLRLAPGTGRTAGPALAGEPSTATERRCAPP